MCNSSVRFRACKVQEAVALTPKLKCAKNPLGFLKTVSELQPQRFSFNRSEWACESACVSTVFQNMLRLLCQGCAFRIIVLQRWTLRTQSHLFLCWDINFFDLYAGQGVTVRTWHGTIVWFKIGKGVWQGCISSPCLFNFYAEYIMWNARLAESWAEIKISWNNINNLRYADGTTLMAESKEELKSLESEREERKSWLESQCSKN